MKRIVCFDNKSLYLCRALEGKVKDHLKSKKVL